MYGNSDASPGYRPRKPTHTTVLGLLILYQGLPFQDMYTNAVLARSIKLAHRLGLYRSATNLLLPRSEAGRRARLFWIMFILDSDVSVRVVKPPLQHTRDHDIVVPLSEVGAGLLRFDFESTGRIVEFDFME